MLIEETTSASAEAQTENTSEVSSAPEPTESHVAESSPAQSTENEAPAKSLLDVVKDAIEPKSDDAEAAEGSSASEAETSEATKEDGEAAQADEPDNFDGLPFSRHPRFKKLVEQRNSLRAATREHEAAIDRLKGPADQYERIETFMRENEISPEEVVDLYRFGALFKSDPEKALEMIQPYVADLFQRTGKLLPADLQADVEEGRITQERAQELSQERARSKHHETRATKAQERVDTVSTQTAQEQQQAQMRTALLEWDAATKARDPDFAAKEDMIADRCAAIISAEGRPADPAAMKAILDRAHTDVTARLKALRPPPRETRPSPTPTTSTTASAQPKTMQEAIALAVQQGV